MIYCGATWKICFVQVDPSYPEFVCQANNASYGLRVHQKPWS